MSFSSFLILTYIHYRAENVFAV